MFSDEEDEEEQYRIEHDLIDLEPVLRDAVVTILPFQPVCREDYRAFAPNVEFAWKTSRGITTRSSILAGLP